jgi:hypothetical protein
MSRFFTSALRTGYMHSREHGLLHIEQLSPEAKVVFHGPTKEFEEKRRFQLRISKMTVEQKRKLLEKLTA